MPMVMAGQPTPPNVPKIRNYGFFIAGLIKGNQWFYISPWEPGKALFLRGYVKGLTSHNELTLEKRKFLPDP